MTQNEEIFKEFYCNFCGGKQMSRYDIRLFESTQKVGGVPVYICTTCVIRLYHRIMDEDSIPPGSICRICGKSKKVVPHLYEEASGLICENCLIEGYFENIEKSKKNMKPSKKKELIKSDIPDISA